MTGSISLSSIPMERITENFSKKTYCTARQMIVWGRMQAGSVAASHAHEQEQIFWVTSGSMQVTIDGATHDCHAGDLITIPSWATHEVRFPVETEYISILSGVRDDLRPGNAPLHLRSSDAAPG